MWKKTCFDIVKLVMSVASEELEEGDIEEMLESHKAR
jgi:hypothetical protein